MTILHKPKKRVTQEINTKIKISKQASSVFLISKKLYGRDSSQILLQRAEAAGRKFNKTLFSQPDFSRCSSQPFIFLL